MEARDGAVPVAVKVYQICSDRKKAESYTDADDIPSRLPPLLGEFYERGSENRISDSGK